MAVNRLEKFMLWFGHHFKLLKLTKETFNPPWITFLAAVPTQTAVLDKES